MSNESPTNPFALAAAIVAILIAAAVGWYLWAERMAQPATVEQPLPAPAPEEPPGPEFPVRAPLPERSTPENLTPLPPLDDSDQYFALELGGVLGEALTELLVDESLIRNVVATIDNLPRQSVAERIRPVGRLDEPFRVQAMDEETYLADPVNFERYKPFVAMLAAADLDAVVDVYRRFYPLFQEAYVNLGYPDAYFNDRLVEVIDHLLATPEPRRPLRFVRPHVLYEYADPGLESLSAGQKAILRSGPENAAELKRILTELRSRLTEAPAQ